jgi:hypothetical protein
MGKVTIQPMTRKKILDLVDSGKESLTSGKLRNDTFLDELMETAANARKAELAQRE